MLSSWAGMASCNNMLKHKMASAVLSEVFITCMQYIRINAFGHHNANTTVVRSIHKQYFLIPNKCTRTRYVLAGFKSNCLFNMSAVGCCIFSMLFAALLGLVKGQLLREW